MDVLMNFLFPIVIIIAIGLIIVCILIGLFRLDDESYYSEIENLSQNGYTVYVDGSAVDFDKIVISDYSTEKIHINDELKEIYISK